MCQLSTRWMVLKRAVVVMWSEWAEDRHAHAGPRTVPSEFRYRLTTLLGDSHWIPMKFAPYAESRTLRSSNTWQHDKSELEVWHAGS